MATICAAAALRVASEEPAAGQGSTQVEEQVGQVESGGRRQQLQAVRTADGVTPTPIKGHSISSQGQRHVVRPLQDQEGVSLEPRGDPATSPSIKFRSFDSLLPDGGVEPIAAPSAVAQVMCDGLPQAPGALPG